MSLAYAILVLLVVYQLKHFLADYLLQGEYMLGKFKPGWAFLKPLLAHVAVHALGTFVISCFALSMLDPGIPFRAALTGSIGLAILDAGLHFIMDRLKASPAYMGRWKPVTAAEYVDARSIITKCETTQFADSWYDGNRPVVKDARAKLRGNRNFWWALGFDQMVHHLTHYACIYTILHMAGAL